MRSFILTFYPYCLGTALSLAFTIKQVTAQNIVPNPSFETAGGAAPGCPPWENAGNGTVDYFQTPTGVPTNTQGYQWPHSGNAYIGGYIGRTGGATSENVTAQLLTTMVSGHQYMVSIHVSLANRHRYAIDRIGVLFTANKISAAGGANPHITTNPSVVNQDFNYITDTAGWTKLQWTYVANGNERWINIGTFAPSGGNNFGRDTLAYPGSSWNTSYYYIDDVCVFDLMGEPANSVRLDTSICEFPARISRLTSGENYLWSNGDTATSTEISTPGTYWVKSTGTCSFSVDTIIVTLAPRANITRVTDTVLCTSADSIRIDLPTQAVDVTWNDADTNKSRTISNVGKYWVSYFMDCTIFTDTFNVSWPAPPVTTFTDTVLCKDDNIVFHLPDDASDIIWSTGESSHIKSISEPGRYWVYYRLPGCIYKTDSIRVVGDTIQPFDLGSDMVLCNTDTTVQLSASEGYVRYTWQDGSSGSTYTVRESGSYKVTVQNENNCALSDSIRVDYVNTRQHFNDAVLCSRGADPLMFEVALSPDATAVWSDGSTGRTIQIYEPGIYSVTVTEGICRSVDSIVVEAEHCECYYVIPNAFTPNNDGRNDIFHAVVENGCPVQAYQLQIFNRWGELVFYSNNISRGWDGTHKGLPCEIGTYFYTVQFEAGTRQKKTIQKGDVTLMR